MFGLLKNLYFLEENEFEGALPVDDVQRLERRV
jgi:hypothetical protein